MVNTATSKPAIGILYLGELGSALAARFVGAGLHVVTTVESRSERTRRRCDKVGVECLATFRDVVESADIVFSIVPPAAALQVANEYAACVDARTERAIFVDLNSVGPEKIANMEKLIVAGGCGFVDGIVHGLAKNVGQGTMIYVSGNDADYVAGHIPASILVRHIAGPAGTAATFKMLLGGLSKGLLAQFLELCMAARKAGLLNEFLGFCYEFYPGVMDVTDRLAPTLFQHVARRADEMTELERTFELLGTRSGFARETRRCYQQLSDTCGAVDFAQPDAQTPALSLLLDLMANDTGTIQRRETTNVTGRF